MASRAVGLVAAATVVLALLGFASPLASAQAADQSASPSSTQLRAEADAIADHYFSALARFESLDADIARSERLVSELSARADKAKADARARALVAYKTSGSQLAALISGTDSLDAAHRAHLIDRINAHDASIYHKLRSATRDLRHQQQALRQARQEQTDALANLRDQGAALDAKLAEASRQEQAAAAATAAAAAAAAQTAPTSAAPSTAPGAAATPTTTTAPPAVAPTPPPSYSGTPGTSPHHDDPFLSCVRARESGGNYAAVNPAGPYLGAYQFLQATWNGAANHAGRSDLVGVPVNVASPYDQDEVAWSLYQWQSTAPWGGSCA